ncbi:helix-turn-helix domain-containing protein [Gemmatimonas sp.]|jgi:transcriptional regulator with XRE-family HTH domain|uniref:helix-turn-helix domain-containing protein n=1 Tax=Gemmatimonas sp. TaxID=1962908 RepID=UPI003DA45C3A
MSEPSVFGRRLRQARDLRELTQAQLAEKSRVSAVMISHFETGVRPSASADNLVKLSNALEVSIDYLLGRTEDPVPFSGPVEAALRSLERAPGHVLDTVLTIAESLATRQRGGPDGSASPVPKQPAETPPPPKSNL